MKETPLAEKERKFFIDEFKRLIIKERDKQWWEAVARLRKIDFMGFIKPINKKNDEQLNQEICEEIDKIMGRFE